MVDVVSRFDAEAHVHFEFEEEEEVGWFAWILHWLF